MTGSKSILLFATTKANIYAMDIMTMQVLWKLQNPPSHGEYLIFVFQHSDLTTFLRPHYQHGDR